jgi:hypothetical protein
MFAKDNLFLIGCIRRSVIVLLGWAVHLAHKKFNVRSYFEEHFEEHLKMENSGSEEH